MGLFRRTKKEETEPVEVAIEAPVEQVRTESPEEIQKEQLRNEIEYLEAEIKSKINHLDSISQKLVTVKEEYDQAVSSLMSSKKEMNEKKSEFDSARIHHEQILQKINSSKSELESVKKEYDEKKTVLDELKKAKIDLDAARAEYVKYKTESEELRLQNRVIQKSYEETQKAQDDISQGLIKANSELELVRKEISEIRKEHESKKKETEFAKKELKFIESQMINIGDRTAPRNIVAAASSVVSSLNAKILAAQKELEVLKVALQRERTEHQETKKSLTTALEPQKEKNLE
jgi:chromosome segregation ATPase